MEEITVELTDETFTWLEVAAHEQKKSISEIVAKMIQEMRAPLLSRAPNTDQV